MKEKETKQETGLSLIEEVKIKVKNARFSFPKPSEVERKGYIGLQLAVLDYLGTELQTYFKNEKLELKEAEIKRADEIENMLKQVYKKKYDVNIHFRDAIMNDLWLKEIQAKLTQLEKTAKKILGGDL